MAPNSFSINGVVHYTPTEKQMQFHARTEPNVLFWGGRGSGKSKALRWDAHMRAMTIPNYKYVILRRTFPELQRSHLLEIPSEMKKLGGRFHYTEKKAFYPNGSIGMFSHCQNEEDVMNLLSAEFFWAGFDEISTFEWEMFTKLAASVRVLKDSGITAMVRAATNPLGVSAENINRYFVLKNIEPDEDPEYNPNDWFEIKANVEDNPHLDRDQYKKRFSGLPEHVRRAWVDGEFGLENALFDFHPTKGGKPYHLIDQIDLPGIVKHAQIYRTFDLGYFPDPAYCAWIAHFGHRYIVFHEKTWFRAVASEIAADMQEIDDMLGIKRIVTTYCDPTLEIHTGADIRTIKDTFELKGVPMECSVNNREHYAAAIHTALIEEAEPGVPRVQIYLNGKMGCPYLAKTLPQQRFDPKRPLALANHRDDHAAVALAYFLISTGSMEHRNISTMKPKPWLVPKSSDRLVLGRSNVKDN